MISKLQQALSLYESSGTTAFEPFAAEAERYAEFHWAHMRKEEDIVLPLTESAFHVEDWEQIDGAFQSNDDPLVGVKTAKEFRDLFRRIVNLAPPPIGVGPSR